MEFIILLILFAGVVCWITDNSHKIFKWFLSILFFPITITLLAVGFIAGIVFEIKEHKKTSID